MSVVIGIDVGGSTTKIVGFRKENGKRELIAPLFIKANDPVTSAYGAFGSFLDRNDLSIPDIEKVLTTGVGAAFLRRGIYNLPFCSVSEFDSIGRGGRYLSGFADCLVVSMGTGTALVHAKHGRPAEYLGGTGVGGGTLMGLSRLLLKAENVAHISELAESGDLSKIDLRIKDITKPKSMTSMPQDMTAANFGNVSDVAEKSDVAKGILNIIFETVGSCSIFAARSCGVRDIVLTGNMADLPFCRQKCEEFNEMYKDVHFMIPELSPFATVIGTALGGFDEEGT